MVQPVRDSFLDLERHRQLLEENVAKLRKSLEHWQMWEVEYEGLKEEIQAVKPEPSFQQLITIGREYGGTLLKQDEVDEVLGIKSGKLRSASQVADLLSKRIDYVRQNVKSLEKQVQTLENKLAAATVISTPDNMNEDGLPLTEIMEELDDNGNVVSSRLSTPGSSKAQLLEVLEKAGVKDLKGGAPVASRESKDHSPAALEEKPKDDESSAPLKENSGTGSTTPEIEGSKVETTVPTQEIPKVQEVNGTPVHAPTKPAKRSVKFAEDIKINTFKRDSRPNLRGGAAIMSPTKDAPPPEVRIPPMETVRKAVENDEIVQKKQQLHKSGDFKNMMDLIKERNKSPPADPIAPRREAETDVAHSQDAKKMADLVEEQNKPLPPNAMVPENEIEEDAALRQEMLKYGMSELGEVGAIVAELTLEEDGSSLTEDDDFDEEEEDEDDDSSFEDEEDEHGRSTRRVVSDDMHRQMRELEQRLNARMMENVGPNGDKNGVPERAAQIKITGDSEELSIEKAVDTKKGVRFADKLDVQTAPKKSQAQPTPEPTIPAKSPVGDIVERAPAPVSESKAAAPAKKVSKFKSARAAQPPTGTPVLSQTINNSSNPPNTANLPKQPPASLPLKPVKAPSPFSAPIPLEVTAQTRTRTAPTGPKDAIISDVVEHDPAEIPPTAPDALDADLLQQEITTEYYKMRNRMIMKEGGFVKDEEPEVDEDGFFRVEADEGGERVSRFKAARLRRDL